MKIICGYCGSEFKPKSQHGRPPKYCSDRCWENWYYEKLKDGHNAVIEKICQQCGELYKVRIAQVKSKYCSPDCRARANGQNRINKRLELINSGLNYCGTCKQIKPIDEFSKLKKSKTGFENKCRQCKSEKHAFWYERKGKYRVRNRNREWQQEYQIKHREHRNRIERDRIKNDPCFALGKRMRIAINMSLKGKKAWRGWEKLVGYAVGDLKKHLEKQFLPGMSWENFSEWHIDHIIPNSLFKYNSAESLAFKKCWGLSNLHPLWAEDNLKKHTKLEKPTQLMLAV